MTKKELIFTSDPNPVDPDVGIYHDLPWEKYAAFNCFSKSMVSAALKSGMHLNNYIHGERKTRAMAFGSLVDTMVLEPEMFEDRYVLQPATYETEKTSGRGANKVTETIVKPWNLNSKTCKALAEEIAASGKEIVTEADLDKAKAIEIALMASPEAALAITEGQKQVSFVWVDEDSGVKCKGRADLVNKGFIDDLKTTMDASPREFSRTIGKFLYHVQAAVYTDAWLKLTGDAMGFRFIVAETGDVPAVALYELDSVSMVAGTLMFARALKNVRQWLDHGIEGYSQFFEPIEAPKWVVDYEINVADVEVEL